MPASRYDGRHVGFGQSEIKISTEDEEKNVMSGVGFCSGRPLVSSG